MPATIGLMNEQTIDAGSLWIRLAFMAVVTAGMLALTFEHASQGAAGMPTAAAYALTVGFGLEFLVSAWARSMGVDARTRLGRG